MSQPKKQDLLNAIESLSANDCAEVLDFVLFLKQKKQAESSKLPPDLMALQGLGKEIWQNIDTDTYLEQERNSWD